MIASSDGRGWSILRGQMREHRPVCFFFAPNRKEAVSQMRSFRSILFLNSSLLPVFKALPAGTSPQVDKLKWHVKQEHVRMTYHRDCMLTPFFIGPEFLSTPSRERKGKAEAQERRVEGTKGHSRLSAGSDRERERAAAS